jgi:hypothetical protein
MKDLYIPVFTDEDFDVDDVRFFRIERTPEIIEDLQKKCKLSAHVKEQDNTLDTVVFHECFQTLKDTFVEITGDDINEPDTHFLEISEDDLGEHYSEDYGIRPMYLKVTGTGLRWTGYGKHCGTVFWTHGVSIEDFVKGEF